MPVMFVVGTFSSRGRAFYYAFAFLHFVAIASNPGANHAIGILPFLSTARVYYAAL
jgi:hypothetical protein